MSSTRNSLIAFALSLLGAAPGVRAADDIHVVELFTSQGCYSCPAADRLLGELIDSDANLIGLELHVDYWDDLVYGSSGRWKDPFSSPKHTARQRTYHGRGLRGRRGVYTPQAVINGRHAVVGADRKAISSALRRPNEYSVAVKVERTDDDSARVVLNGNEKRSAGIWLVSFDRQRVTPVPAGENHGKTLTNHNVVREMTRIGEWRGQADAIVVDRLAADDDRGCAVLVQSDDAGPIFGAALC